MDNRFFAVSNYLKQPSPAARARMARGYMRARTASVFSRAAAGPWATPFAAADRVLVVLIENGGVDLGIPDAVDRILSSLPGSSLIPDSAKSALVEGIREKLKSVTDNLIETTELTLNRYAGSKPEFFGDVIILRDNTSTYDDLKRTLIAQSRSGKIIDVVVLTHGGVNTICLAGDVSGEQIKAIRTEFGGPLGIRAVYMMNCKGSTLNQAWLDAGARVSSGSIQNNYLPEPTTFFFWQAWKDGRPFEEAVTSAYRKTINLMNDTVRGLLLGIPGVGSTLADQVHFENMDFVRDSAPVVQGIRTLTINADDFSTMQSVSNGMATTVLPISLLKSIGNGNGAATADVSATPRCLPISPPGINFMKQWEGLRSKLCNDAEGQCAIGYGTVLHSGACDGRPVEEAYKSGITADAATQLLTDKCAEVQQLITERVTVPLDQNQSDALISFVYNVGAPAFESSTLLRVLNAGDKTAAAAEIRKWTKASNNGTVADAPDLVKRRDAEATLFARSTTGVAQSLSVRNGRSKLAYQKSAVDYKVPGVVQVLKQPTNKTCWAAVMTVMKCWRDNSSTGIRDVLARIGQTYADMFDQDKGLTSDIAAGLYRDAGLETLDAFNPTIEGWEGLLRKYGPLYVDVGYSTGTTTHAIIVTGISGDGTSGGTSITFLDPIPGAMQTLTFDTFLAKYEAKSALNWPYTIVHWPAGASTTNSLAVTHSFRYVSQSLMVRDPSRYSVQQNPAALVIAGIEVADAAQIGLAAIGIVQAQVGLLPQGSFTLTYAQAQRLLTPEARDAMPGSRVAKKHYSEHLLYLGIGAINAAEADIIIDWEGNAYGEIGTPVIRRNLSTSTDWSKSSANIQILKLDRIPLPNTDPRAWPIVYSYDGTYDPYGNGYFEFSGEFEVNAFGGLKFTRHEVVSRSTADFAIGGTPYDKVQRGADVDVPVPEIPAEQVAYLKSRLP
jgi:GH24 family phage-related lysozyme (muramidase)